MPEINDTVLMTGMFGLFTAVIAQIINSFLTIRREKKKSTQEIFNNYIFENMIESLKYVKQVSFSTSGFQSDFNLLMKITNPIIEKSHYGDKYLQLSAIEFLTLNSSLDTDPNLKTHYLTLLKTQFLFLMYSRDIMKYLNMDSHPIYLSQLNDSIKTFAYLISSNSMEPDLYDEHIMCIITSFRIGSFSHELISNDDIFKLRKELNNHVLHEKIYDIYEKDIKLALSVFMSSFSKSSK